MPEPIQVAGQAEVTYQGRAASTAEAGAYLLMLKADGSLQIHHPRGVKPMNWHPKTDSVSAKVEDGFCVLTASRKSPAEGHPQVLTVLVDEQHRAGDGIQDLKGRFEHCSQHFRVHLRRCKRLRGTDLP